jgi:hypothetical protein
VPPLRFNLAASAVILKWVDCLDHRNPSAYGRGVRGTISTGMCHLLEVFLNADSLKRGVFCSLPAQALCSSHKTSFIHIFNRTLNDRAPLENQQSSAIYLLVLRFKCRRFIGLFRGWWPPTSSETPNDFFYLVASL